MKKKTSSEVAAEKASEEPLSNLMTTANIPDLVISVPCHEDSPPTFVLEPPRKGGFRIVARCQEVRCAKSPKACSWSSHLAAVASAILSMITRS